jgi:acyl carrier protein
MFNKHEINLDNNFFDIGGSSLNAVRLVSRIKRELNIDLPLKEIFYNPVLVDIAAKVKMLISEDHTTMQVNQKDIPIIPISDDELEMLSSLQHDDEEEY